ncbi:ATP synthase subunit C [Nitratireductor aestuarii]|uniref:ATP synthase subunit C n=1 Tax=Nitratireductor aestuarii TaxID=1735103 RepID=A0A916W1L2_9HYPH|nr:hydantoinase/oxoprolinase family protein [Nitratireductor aestuarii]GGA58848.1 ATP synthase subunit C [Nitratireductor aestuarii]
MPERSNPVVGFDIGGAHLKVVRVEHGRVVAAMTVGMPLWMGMETLDAALHQSRHLYEDAPVCAFTMTGELSEAYPTRAEGVAGLLREIAQRFPTTRNLIYATRSGLVSVERAAEIPMEVASANWHATASLVGSLRPDALFVDMGSTTTDILRIRDGKVQASGYTDAERLAHGELVYTGFVRSFPIAVASEAPVRGRFTPLMNEYFASMSDVYRILGVLRDEDDQHRTADNGPKTVEASIARVSRLVGHDAGDLRDYEWRQIALWFAERQLRTIHDAAILVSGDLPDDAPLIGAGIGRWQVKRLAQRLDRKFIDFAELLPSEDSCRISASDAAPAAAVALLAVPGL